MGLSPLDFSMYTMTNKLAQNRSYNPQLNVPPQFIYIYNKVSTESKTQRILTSNDYTRETTNIILNELENSNFEDFYPCPSINSVRFEKFADEQKLGKIDDMEDSEEDK